VLPEKDENGNFETVEKFIEGPTSFITTTIYEKLEVQLDDRMLTIHPDESSEQTVRIIAVTADIKFGDISELDKNEILIWEILHESLNSVKVVNPYAKKIGNFVFIYPYVVLTNDPTPPSDICVGPEVGDYSQIAVMSVLLPGVKIGKHCLVGAGSIVGKDVEDYQLVLGSPAEFKKDVRDIKNRKTGEPHYPWPYRFSRGMPWSEIGFEVWEKLNSND